jgi:hypothetical protein
MSQNDNRRTGVERSHNGTLKGDSFHLVSIGIPADFLRFGTRFAVYTLLFVGQKKPAPFSTSAAGPF